MPVSRSFSLSSITLERGVFVLGAAANALTYAGSLRRSPSINVSDLLCHLPPRYPATVVDVNERPIVDSDAAEANVFSGGNQHILRHIG